MLSSSIPIIGPEQGDGRGAAADPTLAEYIELGSAIESLPLLSIELRNAFAMTIVNAHDRHGRMPVFKWNGKLYRTWLRSRTFASAFSQLWTNRQCKPYQQDLEAELLVQLL